MPSDKEPYLVVEFTQIVTVAGLDVQPYNVKNLKLKYSINGVKWTSYKEQHKTKVKIDNHNFEEIADYLLYKLLVRIKTQSI